MPLTFTPQAGSTRQDCAYTYDLAGNIVGMTDDSPSAGIGGASGPFTRGFDYDALYRLVYASGREAGSHVSSSDPNFRPTPDTSVGGTVAYYREYSYDKLSNMLDLYHHGGTGNQFHRVFNSTSGSPFELSNLCEDIEYAGTTVSYTFDANGNMLTEGAGRAFEWDYGDRMRWFEEGTTTAAYLYDGGGNRVKKVVKKAGSDSVVSVYIDGGFEHLYMLDGSFVKSEEHNEVHVMDDRSRVASVREGTPFAGDSSPAVRYSLEDHLGNAAFTLDEAGSLTFREEYFPFGETSFGSYALKRYRYNGKERDEESGLYYYGARYYAPWSCRLVSVDPLAGSMPGSSPYSYAANNPVVMVDLDGLSPTNPPGGGPEKAKSSASNLAKPSIMADDHGNTTKGINQAIESELAYRSWATSTYCSTDHVGEAKAAEDQWLKKWQGMSFGDKWHYQDRAFAIINRQNYENWVDSGNDPEQFHPLQTLKEGLADVGAAAFYSLGGVRSSGKGATTGGYTPGPVKDYSAAPGYSPTLVSPALSGPAVLPGPGLKATQEVGKPANVGRNETKPTANYSIWSLPAHQRGPIIEKNFVGQGVGETGVATNQPVIDKFVPGAGQVFSVKSIDLTLPSYANKPAAVKNLINRYVRDLANFNGSYHAGIRIVGSDVKARILMVAVPPVATKEQIQQMEMSVSTYGPQKGVFVSIHQYR